MGLLYRVHRSSGWADKKSQGPASIGRSERAGQVHFVKKALFHPCGNQPLEDAWKICSWMTVKMYSISVIAATGWDFGQCVKRFYCWLINDSLCLLHLIFSPRAAKVSQVLCGHPVSSAGGGPWVFYGWTPITCGPLSARWKAELTTLPFIYLIKLH